MKKNLTGNTDSVQVIYNELVRLLSAPVSEDHKRDLKHCMDKFMVFLIAKSLYNKPVSEIRSKHMEEFLSEFYTNGEKGKYYYNIYKRLNILFNSLLRQKIIAVNILDQLEFDKAEIDLSSSEKSYFEKKTFLQILDYLKKNDEAFYLYALINYHLMIKSAAIRKIRRDNFTEDFSTLTLQTENSSVAYTLPAPLREELLSMKIQDIPASQNIFTKTDAEFSQSTFFKKWARLQQEMKKSGILSHTDYEVESFAHSNIYEIYAKNGDVFEIQRLLNRSTVYKTKEYLKKIIWRKIHPNTPETKLNVSQQNPYGKSGKKDIFEGLLINVLPTTQPFKIRDDF